MKNIFLSLCIIIALSSCNNNVKPDYALFSGTIQNTTAKELSVFGNGFTKKISIHEDGSFADTLKIEKSGYYSSRIEKEFIHMFLSKGDMLTVNIDMKDIENSFSFTGSAADVNNYLLEKKRLKEKLTGDILAFYTLDEKKYVEKNDSIFIGLNTLLSNAKLSSDFQSIEEKNNYYDKLLNLEQYVKYHGMAIKDTSYRVPENFLNEVENTDFTLEEDYVNSASYRMLILAHYMSEFKKTFEITNDYTLALKEVLKDVPKGIIKNNLLEHTSSFILGPNESLKEAYDYFMENSTNDKDKESFTEKYDNFKTLAKGSPSPGFNYENYNGGTTTLADLKGKFVYIDVWATWCAPCKKEIPFLIEMEKEFHGKNIAFVSISVDKKKDHEVWRNMIKEKGLKGIQLFADNDRSSQFYKDYKITGIPRFILIDTEGNIISADELRPSNPKLIEKLNSLLN